MMFRRKISVTGAVDLEDLLENLGSVESVSEN